MNTVTCQPCLSVQIRAEMLSEKGEGFVLLMIKRKKMGEKQQQEKHTKKKEERCAEEKPFCVFEEVRLLKLFFFQKKEIFHQKWAHLPCRTFLFIKSCTAAAVSSAQNFPSPREQHLAMKVDTWHRREGICCKGPETNKQRHVCVSCMLL